MYRSIIYNKSPEELQEILDNSSSFSEVLQKVGLKTSSSTVTLKRIIAEYGLSTNKLEGNRYKREHELIPKTSNNTYDLESKLHKEVKTSSHKLKLKLIESGLKEHKCEICGLSEWLGKPIKLQLHHIDGDHLNNELSNLQILCPNCHSMTDNFGVYNSRRFKETKHCSKCGKILSKSNKTSLCRECYMEFRKNNSSATKSNVIKGKKILCPVCKENMMDSRSSQCKECDKKYRHRTDIYDKLDRDTLKNLIRNNSFVTIVKMFGKSDNAVRKWCKKYCLPSKSTDIQKLSDAEWEFI